MSSPAPSSPSSPGAPPRRTERGIPDGAIVGLLAVLLGTTALVWAATELGGLLSHGRFPRPLPFLSTAGAIRHLATAPNDLPGAWPGTPTTALPSPTAFWLTFFALLAVALFLLLSAAAARAKHRVAHGAPRDAAAGAPPAGPTGFAGFATPGGRAIADNSPGHGGPAPTVGYDDADRTGRSSPYAADDGPTGPGRPTGTVGHPVAGDPGGARPGAPFGPPATPGPVGPPGPRRAPGAAEAHAAAPVSPVPVQAAGNPTAGDAYATQELTAWPPANGAVSGTPPAGGMPRPGGATASGWARGGARADTSTASAPFGSQTFVPHSSPAQSSVTPWFALPPSGTVCVFAPEAGAAARRALVGAAIAQGARDPLVVVTADAALWDARPPHRRAERFDPQHVTAEDIEDSEAPRARWAPHNGCAEPVVAAARARALLLATVRPVADRDEQAVRALAETLLRCWLRAAALDGRPFRHVARWAGGGSAGGSGAGRQEAVGVLQSAATPADLAAGEEPWAGQLQAALLQPPSALDPALGRIRAALGSVAELHVLAACTPDSPASALDPEALLQGGAAGSLYILGRPGDGRLREPGAGAVPAAHSAMPLLSALVDDVVQRAWRTDPQDRAEAHGSGLLLVLDDIAAVAPFPTLPQLMADGGTQGLRAVALLRSPEQARARWGERAVHSLWTSADHRAVLGPLSPAPLAALLASLGAAEYAPQPGLAADELLMLPGPHRAGHPQHLRIRSADSH